MPLEVAVGAVITGDLKEVLGGLQCPTRALPAVGAPIGPRCEHARALGVGQRQHAGAHLVERQARRRPQRVGQHTGLAIGVELEQAHHRPIIECLAGIEHRRGHGGRTIIGGPAVQAVTLAAVFAIHPGEEVGDYVAQCGEHLVAHLAGLGQGMRAQAHYQRLPGLPTCVHAHVGRGGRGQHAAHRIQRPGAKRTHSCSIVGRWCLCGHEVVTHHGVQACVGGERIVKYLLVAAQQIGVSSNAGRPHILPAAVQLGVVGHVPRGLLQIAGQAPPLDDLGQHVAHALDGHVRATQLRHRVIPVIGEHPLEELAGPVGSDLGPTRRRRAAAAGNELVQKDAPHRVGRP